MFIEIPPFGRRKYKDREHGRFIPLLPPFLAAQVALDQQEHRFVTQIDFADCSQFRQERNHRRHGRGQLGAVTII
jgi:hypothetical protein